MEDETRMRAAYHDSSSYIYIHPYVFIFRQINVQQALARVRINTDCILQRIHIILSFTYYIYSLYTYLLCDSHD